MQPRGRSGCGRAPCKSCSMYLHWRRITAPAWRPPAAGCSFVPDLLSPATVNTAAEQVANTPPRRRKRRWAQGLAERDAALREAAALSNAALDARLAQLPRQRLPPAGLPTPRSPPPPTTTTRAAARDPFIDLLQGKRAGRWTSHVTTVEVAGRHAQQRGQGLFVDYVLWAANPGSLVEPSASHRSAKEGRAAGRLYADCPQRSPATAP